MIKLYKCIVLSLEDYKFYSFLSYRGPFTVDLENMSDDEDNGECKTDTSGSSTAGKKNDRRLKKTKIEKKVEKSSK